jgi:hypothetical protein
MVQCMLVRFGDVCWLTDVGHPVHTGYIHTTCLYAYDLLVCIRITYAIRWRGEQPRKWLLPCNQNASATGGTAAMQSAPAGRSLCMSNHACELGLTNQEVLLTLAARH